jgi:transposase
MADNGGRWAAGMKPETDEASRGRMRERQRVDGMLILSVEQIMKECFGRLV